MNSMVALDELRAAKTIKQQKECQCEEIKKQLEKIHLLRREKAALLARLAALSQDTPVDELDRDLVPSIRDGKRILYTLQEKLSAYRLIGPCGLTVADVDTNCLVVTFTSMWKNITESFILKIVAIDGQVKVSGTSIPYFIDVQSMLDKSKSPAWHLLMDDIGRRLNAYIQRKGELDYVMKEYKDVVKDASPNESVTSLELVMHKKDTSTKTDKELCVYLVYPGVDATLPGTVSISTENMALSQENISLLEQELKSSPLSSAMSALVSAIDCGLVRGSMADESFEDDSTS